MKKITFLELGMRNFFSYGNKITKVNLNFSDAKLVVGTNKDSVVNGQEDSNGSGKSTILNAITYCCYDKTIQEDQRADEMINDINGKDMEVYVTFKKGDTFYKISRYRKNRKMGGNGVRLYIREKNDKFTEDDDKTPDSVANTNIKIKEILGMPFEVFSRIIVYVATHEPFLSLPSRHATKANQSDIIDELFGYTEIAQKAERLKEKIKNNKAELKTLYSLEEQIKAQLERQKEKLEQLRTKKEQWDSENEEKLENLNKNAEELNKIDFEEQQEFYETKRKLENDNIKKVTEIESKINEIKSAIRTLEQDKNDNQKKLENAKNTIERYKNIDFENIEKALISKIELNDKVKDIKSALKTYESDLERDTSEYEKNDNERKHLEESKCPYCLQDYEASKEKLQKVKSTIENLTKEIKNKNKTIKKLEKAKEETESEINGLDTGGFSDVSSVKDSQHAYSSAESFLSEYESKDFDSEIDALRTALEAQEKKKESKEKSFNKKIKVLDESLVFNSEKELNDARAKLSTISREIELVTEAVNPYIEQIDSYELMSDDGKGEEIDSLTKSIDHQEFLLKLLTKKESFVRKALLNRNIPYLNGRIHHYLRMIGLPHKVEFQQDMTVLISQFGKEKQYRQLSSGQKARVNLALNFAFRDVVQARHHKIDFCVLDECLDVGLGNVGVQQAATMIKNVAKEDNLSMLVISHRDEISNMFKNKLHVVLENGFSEIVNQ